MEYFILKIAPILLVNVGPFKLSHLLYLSDLIGLKTLSGKMMNLEQAVIAFDKTTSATGLRDTNQSEVRKYMKEVG